MGLGFLSLTSCEPQALLHCSGYVVASHKLTVLESLMLTYWSCNYRLCIFGAQDHWKPNNHNEQLILHFTASFLVHTPFGWPHCNNYNTSIFLLEYKYCQFSSVQSLSSVQFFATPWIAAHQASLAITNSWSWLKLMSIESVIPFSHLILCRPLLLLPPIPPSIRVFSSESTFRMRWPSYWSFSFSISPSNEHPGLISFRMDWLDLLENTVTAKEKTACPKWPSQYT